MLYASMFRPAPHRPRPMGEMHYLDSAQMLLHLQAAGHSLADMAHTSGLTAHQVIERIRLCELDEGLRAYLRQEGVPEKIALILLRLPDPLSRRRMALRIVREHLCIRDAALLVDSARNRRTEQPPPPSGQHVIKVIRDIRPFRNAIRDIAGQMNDVGVRATFTERRSGGMQELTVAYPTRRRRTERYQSM